MLPTTRAKFKQYQAAQAKLYNTQNMVEPFTVDPDKTQRFIGGVQESAEFLQQINMPMVRNQAGSTVIIGVDKFTGGRTDTSTKDRTPNQNHTGTENDYMCNQTNFDTELTYAQIDAFAHHPNFTGLISAQNLRAHALSKISIGWNGTSLAADSNIATNPLGQDCGVGWLQKLKERNPEKYLDEDDITINDNDNNLDVLVNQLVHRLPDVHQSNPDLVVILGSDLIAHGKDRFYAKNGLTPTEKEKIEMTQVISTYGGKPAYMIPFFPKRGIFVTTFKNLSIYIQEGTMRRYTKEKVERDRIINYSSMNIDFMLEDLDLAVYLNSANVYFEGETIPTP